MQETRRSARPASAKEWDMRRRISSIGFVSSETPEAQASLERLQARYQGVDPEDAAVIVALGGDGLMLQTLHRFMGRNKPIYGMHRGSVGFLMNEYCEDDLISRLDSAMRSIVSPLLMRAVDRNGVVTTAHAINEVSLLRQTHQAARLRISIDGKVRMEELTADGVLVATPAGSTAYNLSAHGPILPLNARLLALTPLAPFRPRRWRGALLPSHASIGIDILEADKRPVSAVADGREVRHVQSVRVQVDDAMELVLLHDPDHGLEERILREQFGY